MQTANPFGFQSVKKGSCESGQSSQVGRICVGRNKSMVGWG